MSSACNGAHRRGEKPSDFLLFFANFFPRSNLLGIHGNCINDEGTGNGI